MAHVLPFPEPGTRSVWEQERNCFCLFWDLHPSLTHSDMFFSPTNYTFLFDYLSCVSTSPWKRKAHERRACMCEHAHTRTNAYTNNRKGVFRCIPVE